MVAVTRRGDQKRAVPSSSREKQLGSNLMIGFFVDHDENHPLFSLITRLNVKLILSPETRFSAGTAC